MRGLSLISDHAIAELDNDREDALGFSNYAGTIAQIVYGTRGPFTIGIFGEWGMGKTSLMKMVEQRLLDASKTDHLIIPVWFNAWMFERVEYPAVPLIKSIVEAIKPYDGVLEKSDEAAAKLVSILESLAQALKLKGKMGAPGDTASIEMEVDPGGFIQHLRSRIKRRKYGLADDDPYEDIFSALNAIGNNAVPRNMSIVVLIDDLDRCFPENAVKLLESIKLILSQPGFIYILGASRVVIEEYLQSKYQKQYGIAHYDGKAYLDKMIQLSFDIPPHSARVNEFTEQIVANLKGAAIKKELGAIAPVIAKVCQFNPRTIIRFINSLITDSYIYRHSHAQAGQKLPIGISAVTRSLQRSWIDFYGLLIGDDPHEDREYCTILSKWANDEIVWWKNYDVGNPEHDDYAKAIIGDSNIVEADVLKQLAAYLYDDRTLKSLMTGDTGRDWLKRHQLREASISFTTTQLSNEEKNIDNNMPRPSSLPPSPSSSERTAEDLIAKNEIYEDAIKVIIDANKASTSLLQRKLRIGYGRAARIIEEMEQQGIIGPSDGARPREVLARTFEEAVARTTTQLSDIGTHINAAPTPISEDIIRRVELAMPEQPWKTGTSKRVAGELGISSATMKKAKAALIERGVFKRQIDGVLYESLPSQPIDKVKEGD